MPVKTITHPVTGQTFRFGRNRTPLKWRPRLHFAEYRTMALPPIPPSCNYGPKASAVLAQMLMNDTLGCCTASGAFHIDGVALANAGTPVTWTDQQVVEFYSATSGYVPGNPATDNGANEQDVLAYWAKNGLLQDGSHKILGWLSINPANSQHVREALYLFENLYFGMELPDAWVNPMPSGSGFTWAFVGGEPDPDNGHCVAGYGYAENGNLLIDSWGMQGEITPAAVATYCSQKDGGDLFTVITPDILARATQKAPNGIGWADLQADFVALRQAA
jgi:hypothetical protein